MTTAGHILPGYCDTPEDRPRYSRLDFRRSKTAHVGRTALTDEDRYRFGSPYDQASLDEIRNAAKNLWLSADVKEPTTYNTHFREIVGHPPATYRPSSPSRRNKPHPKQIFLTCRLHHVPGYHNADTTLGKDPYVTDGMTTGRERWSREQARAKFVPRPTTSAVNQYRKRYQYQGLENLSSPVAQATEAWLNIVNDEDKEKLLHELKLIPSKQERAAMPMPVISPSPQFGRTLDSFRPRGMEGMEQRPKTCKPRSIYRPIPRRGDYLLHPEWPPTLAGHELPCLC